MNWAENCSDTPFRQLSKGNNYVAMETVRLFQGVKFYQNYLTPSYVVSSAHSRKVFGTKQHLLLRTPWQKHYNFAIELRCCFLKASYTLYISFKESTSIESTHALHSRKNSDWDCHLTGVNKSRGQNKTIIKICRRKLKIYGQE